MPLGLALALMFFPVCAIAATEPDGLTVDTRGVTLREGPVTLNLGGRLHYDYSDYDERGVDVRDAGIRRARLELAGAVGDQVRFRVDRELAGGGGWRNLWVAVRPGRRLEVRAGNFVVPFSQEELQSSNASPLIERSAMSALAPSYGLGGQVAVSGRRWSLTAGGFDDGLADDDGGSSSRGRGVIARATGSPVLDRRRAVHLGAAVELRDDDGADVRLQTRAAAFGPAQARTGRIADVGRLSNIGVEGALRTDRLLVQAQYMRTDLHRRARADLTLDGWFIQASRVIGGAQRGYNPRNGLFGSVDLAEHRPTFEIAARYSELDIESSTLNRGHARTATLGGTWYLSRNARAMLNATRARTEGVARTRDRTANILAMRLQASF